MDRQIKQIEEISKKNEIDIEIEVDDVLTIGFDKLYGMYTKYKENPKCINGFRDGYVNRKLYIDESIKIRKLYEEANRMIEENIFKKYPYIENIIRKEIKYYDIVQDEVLDLGNRDETDLFSKHFYDEIEEYIERNDIDLKEKLDSKLNEIYENIKNDKELFNIEEIILENI